MSNPIQEVLDRIERRQSVKKVVHPTGKWRRDGFQTAFEPEYGCHLVTIIRGVARGATLCLTAPENQPPSDDEIEAAVARKEKEFRQAKEGK